MRLPLTGPQAVGPTQVVTASARRVRLALVAVSAAWIVVAGALWLVSPPHSFSLMPAAWAFLVLILASRVQFGTPFGLTAATQLAFVPLLFVVPPALAGPAVAAALALSVAPDVVRGRMRPSGLLRTLRNSWFALGPAWVLAIVGSRHDLTVLVLVAALASQFAVDMVVSGLYLVATRSASPREQIGDAWVYAVDAGLSGIGFVVALQARETPVATLAIVPLLGVLAMFARERTGRLEKLVELNETYRGTALLLGDVVEADDAYTGLHSQGVVTLALAVGDALGLGVDHRRDLEFAALLHDVGKIAIPKEIINKPGKLDAAEWELVKTHAAEGQRMLARVGGFMLSVGEIVRSHHERWDGRGYPDGLVAEEAPLAARIITCCDSWSAMRTDRPYRRALSFDAAVAEVHRNAGSQFDPVVAQALLRVVRSQRDAPSPPPAPEILVPTPALSSIVAVD